MSDFIQNNWDKLTTILFACLSAVFAGITVLLTYLSYRRDNPKIKARVSRGFFTYTNGNLVDCMICGVTNYGRRSVTISQIYFSVKGGGNLIFFNNSKIVARPITLPFVLSEGRNEDVYFFLDEIKIALKENKTKLKAVCFKDDTGRIYKGIIKSRKWKELYQ